MSSTGTVTILVTADLHGRVEPIDPLSGRPFPGGIARAATLLERARARDPEAIYLDLGDLVQGTPAAYFSAKERPDDPHPMVRILNRLGCEGLVVGNHEFNFGLPWLRSLRRHANFPVLGANVLGPDGTPWLEPVLRVERKGKRIAILALTTPQVPRWEEPWNYEGLSFRDAIETVREWLPRLRGEADAVVVAAHMGWEGVTDGGLEDPSPRENDIGRLVQEVEGLDAVLMGHTHEFAAARVANGSFVLQPGSAGKAVGELELHWDGGERAPRVEGRFVETGLETPADEGVRVLVREEEEYARSRIDEVLGVATGPFDPGGARFGDNPLLTLLHKVQLRASGAELSSTALFRAEEGIAAGPVRLVDLFRVYPYENDLTIVELAVDDVRDYLEQIAVAYVGAARNGEPPPLHPGISIYNHDALAGVEYVIDPARPVGKRVTCLTFGGETRAGGSRVTLALTSYRAQGGGGYRALKRARVVERTGREVRRLLTDYIRAEKEIRPEVFGNWRVEGVEAGEGAVRGNVRPRGG